MTPVCTQTFTASCKPGVCRLARYVQASKVCAGWSWVCMSDVPAWCVLQRNSWRRRWNTKLYARKWKSVSRNCKSCEPPTGTRWSYWPTVWLFIEYMVLLNNWYVWRFVNFTELRLLRVLYVWWIHVSKCTLLGCTVLKYQLVQDMIHK